MKKQYIYIAAVITFILAMTACNERSTSAKLPKLNSEIDSLNYAFGLSNGSQMNMMIRMDDDSTGTKKDQMIKGIYDELNNKEEANEATNVGREIGSWLQSQKTAFLGDSTLNLNYKLFKQGFVNSIKDEEVLMSAEEANTYLQSVIAKRQEQKMLEQFGENKTAGEKFLAENAKREGVITTESGLQYEVIKLGKGARPKETDVVKVNYEGKLINDTIFDSSYKRNEPASFPLNQVIKGWTEGMQLMPVGSKFRFYVPQELGYGFHDQPSIPAFSTLIFDVELLSIEKGQKGISNFSK